MQTALKGDQPVEREVTFAVSLSMRNSRGG